MRVERSWHFPPLPHVYQFSIALLTYLSFHSSFSLLVFIAYAVYRSFNRAWQAAGRPLSAWLWWQLPAPHITSTRSVMAALPRSRGAQTCLLLCSSCSNNTNEEKEKEKQTFLQSVRYCVCSQQPWCANMRSSYSNSINVEEKLDKRKRDFLANG